MIWRELFIRLPSFEETEKEERYPTAGRSMSRGMVGYVLEGAMSRFDARPEREELAEALDEEAQALGDPVPMVGTMVFEAYQALDRMEGNLTPWSEGLPKRKLRAAREARESQKARGHLLARLSRWSPRRSRPGRGRQV